MLLLLLYAYLRAHSCTHAAICNMVFLMLFGFSSFFSQVVGLNFSSATSPELLLKTFDHYCEYRRTPNGVVMAPIQLGKWVVLFCDEINLPDLDKYGKCQEDVVACNVTPLRGKGS